MDDLKDFWNKNTARIPQDKGQSLYAAEKELLFPRQSHVCDLGGGTGSDSLYFINQGHNVTLVDIADDALRVAVSHVPKSGSKEKLTVVQCDFSSAKLPLENDSYDIVYSRLALHYFPSQVLSRLFAEVYRILRQGGRTYLTLKSADDNAEMEFLTSTATEKEEGVFDDNGRIKTRYSIDKLEEILSSAGISKTDFQVKRYVEKLGNENDVVKSGNSEFIVNEITIHKPA
jgi:ubiquinone/menaquinone biosynthesis C-methylase UbiE